MRQLALAAALLGLATGIAGAQVPARPAAPNRPGANARAPRVMGQITKVSGTVYTVKEMRGQSVKLTIPASTPVTKAERQKASTKDLKVGVNIAATTKAPSTAGAATATRVMILPPMTMGAVQSITATKVTLKTADGKTVGYTINAKTRLPKGERAVKAGDRVVVVHTGSTADAIRHIGQMGGRGGMRPNGARPGGQRGPR
jgi:hypothetical protein